MANDIKLKLTNYGLRRLMTNGAEQTFKYCTLSDMNEIYYVTPNPELSDIMNITGSKNLFTARKSCIDAVPTIAQVTPPQEETIVKTEQRWLVNFYNKNCGVYDYDKTNLDITINLHEYFNWLEGLVTSGYDEESTPSLKLIQGIDLIKQEQNFINNTWENVDITNKFSASYNFVSDEDRKNYLKFNSKDVSFEGQVRKQNDKSFNRFYTSLLLGFGVNVEGNYYLEGHNSLVTFQPPQFGYVVNGTTNFVPLNKLSDPSKYKQIKPATILGSAANDLYYLKEPKKFRTQDYNGFIGQAIWGYVNNKGESLIKGMIEKAKNHIEFYFKETSFDKWELPINLRLQVSDTGGLKLVGGNVRYNFVYDPNATILGYNNILIIK